MSNTGGPSLGRSVTWTPPLGPCTLWVVAARGSGSVRNMTVAFHLVLQACELATPHRQRHEERAEQACRRLAMRQVEQLG
jgi:hypothetical protein